MKPLVYLKTELGFKLSDWQALGKDDQQTLKEWALEEMRARGIKISE